MGFFHVIILRSQAHCVSLCMYWLHTDPLVSDCRGVCYLFPQFLNTKLGFALDLTILCDHVLLRLKSQPFPVLKRVNILWSLPLFVATSDHCLSPTNQLIPDYKFWDALSCWTISGLWASPHLLEAIRANQCLTFINLSFCKSFYRRSYCFFRSKIPLTFKNALTKESTSDSPKDGQ